MVRATPEQLFISKLMGTAPKIKRLDWLHQMSDKDCLQALRESTGLDLGPDPQVWHEWWSRTQSHKYYGRNDPDKR